MKVSTRERDGVTIIQPEGKITIGAGDVALKKAIVDALEEGHTKLLLDMSKVTTLDSSGIGELVGAYTTVTNRGGAMRLLNLPPKIAGLLAVTQLITVFEVYDDEEAAVGSF